MRRQLTSWRVLKCKGGLERFGCGGGAQCALCCSPSQDRFSVADAPTMEGLAGPVNDITGQIGVAYLPLSCPPVSADHRRQGCDSRLGSLFALMQQRTSLLYDQYHLLVLYLTTEDGRAQIESVTICKITSQCAGTSITQLLARDAPMVASELIRLHGHRTKVLARRESTASVWR